MRVCVAFEDLLQRLGLAFAGYQKNYPLRLVYSWDGQRQANGVQLLDRVLDNEVVGNVERGGPREEARGMAILSDSEQDEIEAR